MLAGFARQFNSLSLPKAAYQLGVASLLLLMGASSVHDATALNETRSLSFHHTHSDEDLTVTFKRDGRYDEEALKQINHYLRDWRSQDETVMDRHLFDILWEVYREVDAKKPIQIVSAYRSPATNAMLRRRSAGVARFSQHMLGHAMDFYIPDVSLEQVRFAGLRLQRGGVGFYPSSGSPFVHLDTGSIRHWPRMTHDQLARVFPDGRTVHVPADGAPLSGYELARADIEKRENGSTALTRNKPSLLAALFGSKSSDDEDESAGAAVASDKGAPRASSAAAIKVAENVPVPRAKPRAAIFQLASADAQLVQPAKARRNTASQTGDANPQTPADIINSRGFWDDAPATPKQATPAQVAAISARRALNAADPQPTSSVSAAFDALAYAPLSSSPVARPNVVAAAAPAPRSIRTALATRAPTNPDTIVSKGPQGPGNVPVAASARLAAYAGNEVWMRVMILAPSASTSMNATVLGDTNMTTMRRFFIKPQTAVVMSFSEDPQLGLVSERFTGSATASLATQSFVLRTASLR